ncbi:hypothetical protein PENSPDRAFT_686733 [Peniophora sp. CONT]|nr:hypothetical protein PENSPDRAFT_686733 [Peniophora sp. CONT]
MYGFKNILISLHSIAAHVACVHGQGFNIPSDWRKPNSNRTRSERVSIAQSAIELLTPAINLTGDGTSQGMSIWSSGNVPASLAQYDYVSDSQDHHNIVSSTISVFRDTHPALFDKTQTLRDVTSDPIMWGLAAFYGARAYNDTNLLNIATDAWEVAQPYAVSVQDGATGTQPTRNQSFPIDCVFNVTSAGAVFWVAYQPYELESNVITVGAYASLSAHLWESTNNTTYLNAAQQSASFIYSHLYSESDQILWDSYNLSSCQHNGYQWIHNQGFFLESISVLSSAPIPGSSTWETLLKTLVVSTVNNPIWVINNGSNAGVLVGDSASDPQNFQDMFMWKNVFIRALYEIWTRLSPSDPMGSLIQAFVTVQYNALIDLASVDGNIYSPIWTGPPDDTILPWGQLSALDVLNAAIGMSSLSRNSPTTVVSEASESPTSTPTIPSIPILPARPVSGGAIAGIVVGGIIVAALIVASLLLLKRNVTVKRRRDQGLESRKPEPFTSSIPDLQRPFVNTLSLDSNDKWYAAYAVKNRRRDLAVVRGESSVSASSPAVARPPRTESSASPPVSTEISEMDGNRTTMVTPGDASETALTRLVQQVIDRMHVHEAPPSYTGQ